MSTRLLHVSRMSIPSWIDTAHVDVNFVRADVLSLQDPESGSFAGDEWGETDTRFACCAVNCLALLGRLDELDADKTASWLASCKNFDGGFGMVPGAESHAAQGRQSKSTGNSTLMLFAVWTSVSALTILGRLDVVDKDTLCWWLCERQLPNGGLNGRPEKLEDVCPPPHMVLCMMLSLVQVCYSWWVFASLSILGRGDWIDHAKLQIFILSCQDNEKGGIADRPEDMADVWHTIFGIAGELMSMRGGKRLSCGIRLVAYEVSWSRGNRSDLLLAGKVHAAFKSAFASRYVMAASGDNTQHYR